MATELRDIATSVNASNRASGQFRQAAIEGNRNMSKISKDLYTLFNIQRKESNGIVNAINEASVETQQTGAKVTQTNALLQESLGIQNAMLSELKNISIGLKSSNDVLRMLAGIGLANTDTSKIDPMSGVGRMLSNVGPKLGIGGLTMGGGIQGLTGPGPDTNFKAENGPARESAEKYLGRKMSDTEWSELVKVTHAEAGKNQMEVAGVVASVLNRTRDSKGKTVSEVIREKNQFSSVRDNVAGFVNGPESKRAESIYGSITNHLEKWDKKQKDFQAANPAAYNTPGDGGRGAEKIQAKLQQGFSQTGASIFNTRPTGVDQNAPSGSKVDGIPSGDISALGKALQAQGLRVSEHPEFGGVNPVHKGKAHYEGRALDINIGRGNVEANDPVMGERFDKLAEQLKAAGYKVIWRDKGHYDHIHVEAGTGGGKGNEPPAAVSNAEDAPKAPKPMPTTPPSTAASTPSAAPTQKPVEAPTSSVGTKAFSSVFENGDSWWGGISPKSILQEYIGTGLSVKDWFTGKGQAAPKPEQQNTDTSASIAKSKAIQSVATSEKVQEARAQEATTTPRAEAQTTPAADVQTAQAPQVRHDYNGPNDVSIHGDGWTRDVLKYFGVIGGK